MSLSVVDTTGGQLRFKFDGKTPAYARDLLRANGWRYNRILKCWTRTATDAARQKAEAILKLIQAHQDAQT